MEPVWPAECVAVFTHELGTVLGDQSQEAPSSYAFSRVVHSKRRSTLDALPQLEIFNLVLADGDTRAITCAILTPVQFGQIRHQTLYWGASGYK